MKIIYIYFFLLIASINIYSQKETYNMYYPVNGGLTFNISDTCPNPPCAVLDNGLTEVSIKIFNECRAASYAAISDENGNLLFYTDGLSILNRHHQLIKNGIILDTINKKTQDNSRTIIIKKPKTNNIYYYIKNGYSKDYGILRDGLSASTLVTEIDINSNNGQGEVVKEMDTLSNNSSKAISAVLKRNKLDYWIVIHEKGNQDFKLFSVTDTGISKHPLIQKVGAIIPDTIPFNYSNEQEILKFSPSGKYLARMYSHFLVSIPDSNAAKYYDTSGFMIEIYDFNNESGELKLKYTIKPRKKYYWRVPCGIEFSPDESKFYASFSLPLYSGGYFSDFYYRLYQYDLLSKTEEEFNNSAYIIAKEEFIHSNYDEFNGWHDMQVLSDGKIYIAINKMNQSKECYLSRINHPNRSGKECDFELNAMSNRTAKVSPIFSYFVQSYFHDKYDTNYVCSEPSFDIQKFKDESNFIQSGHSKIQSNIVILSDTIQNTSSAIWYKDKVSVASGFKTEFSFRLSKGNNNGFKDGSPSGADGIALVIQNYSSDIVGSRGEGIGYHGIPNSIAVEIDNYKNTGINNKHDPNGNHIAVQALGRNPNSSDHESGACLGIAANMYLLHADSNIYYCKIDYNIVPNTMRVFLNTTDTYIVPTLEVKDIKLDKLLELDNGGMAYIGLTASTGLAYQKQEILNWSFCAKELDSIFVGIQEKEKPKSDFNSLIITPNPANNDIRININFEKPEKMTLSLFSNLGSEIAKIIDNKTINSGLFTKNFDTQELESGVYYFVLKTANFTKIKKIVVIH